MLGFVKEIGTVDLVIITLILVLFFGGRRVDRLWEKLTGKTKKKS